MERPLEVSRCAARRLGVFVFSACLLVLSRGAARADVIGIGDHLPAHEDMGEAVSDLPQFGGPVTGGLVVVGGTGQGIGGTGAGQMTIDIPSETLPLQSNRGIIGRAAPGLGLVRIIELNSQWNIVDDLLVGDEGQGFLELIAGARLFTDNLFTSAPPGAGDIDVPDLSIGNQPGSQGFVTLDGISTIMVNNVAQIGRRSFGTISVINRARLETLTTARIGDENEEISGVQSLGEGYVLIDGLGSRWNVGFITLTSPATDEMDLEIGFEGRGTVEVLNQGRVRVGSDTFMGIEAGSFGQIVVSGRNSEFTTLENMTVGDLGEALMQISDNGVVRTDLDTVIGDFGIMELNNGTYLTTVAGSGFENNGVIRGSGRIETPNVVNFGDIRNAAALSNLRERLLVTGPVENNENIESIGGEMEFRGVVDNNGFGVDPAADGDVFGKDAIFRFLGGLNNNLDGRITLDNTIVEGNIVDMGGDLIVVDDARASSVLGNLTFSGASDVFMNVGDNEFSRMTVTDTLTAAGALNVFLDPGYNPVATDSFTLFTASSVIGTFTLNMLDPSPGIGWSLTYTPTSVILNAGAPVVLPIGADFNASGQVNGADLTIWGRNFGGAAGPTTGDADLDGDADGFDFLAWQRQFGGPGAVVSVAAGGAVPEPGTAALAAIGLAAAAWAARRSKVAR